MPSSVHFAWACSDRRGKVPYTVATHTILTLEIILVMHYQTARELSVGVEKYFFLNFNTLTFCGWPLNFLIQDLGEASTLGAMIN